MVTKTKYFKITKNTVRPLKPEYGWLTVERLEDLYSGGFDPTTLGTEWRYLVEESGRVFNPVGASGVIASQGYIYGWKFEGDVLYPGEDDEWLEWDELPRERRIEIYEASTRMGAKRWFAPDDEIPEPKQK